MNQSHPYFVLLECISDCPFLFRAAQHCTRQIMTGAVNPLIMPFTHFPFKVTTILKEQSHLLG